LLSAHVISLQLAKDYGNPRDTALGRKDLRPRAAWHDRGHQAMPIVSTGRKKADAGRSVRGNAYDATLCFGLEPIPKSISHSLTVALQATSSVDGVLSPKKKRKGHFHSNKRNNLALNLGVCWTLFGSEHL
jgi:hypothetical protein